jgi:hypothetical protein
MYGNEGQQTSLQFGPHMPHKIMPTEVLTWADLNIDLKVFMYMNVVTGDMVWDPGCSGGQSVSIFSISIYRCLDTDIFWLVSLYYEHPVKVGSRVFGRSIRLDIFDISISIYRCLDTFDISISIYRCLDTDIFWLVSLYYEHPVKVGVSALPKFPFSNVFGHCAPHCLALCAWANVIINARSNIPNISWLVAFQISTFCAFCT